MGTTTKLIMLSLLLDGVLKIIFHTGYIKIKKGTCYINKYGSAPVVSEKTTGQADPISTKPTPAPSADCDLTEYIGPATGTYNISFGGKKVECVCHAGKCVVPGAKNSCVAICGQDPC